MFRQKYEALSQRNNLLRLWLLVGLSLSIFCSSASYAQSGRIHFHRHRHAQSKLSAGGPFSGAPRLLRTDFKTVNQKPAAGARVYVFAVGMGGPNTGGISLLNIGSSNNSQTVFSDALQRGYIVTDGDGNFDLTGLYAMNCPSNSTSVYLMGVGGSSGGPDDNPYNVSISAIPVACSQMPNLTFVAISEATSVAAAFALNSYADTSDDGISTTPANNAALTQAFLIANSIVPGGYPGPPPIAQTEPGVPVANPDTQTDVDTIADILAACINSDGGPICVQLMNYTATPGKAAPVDTWQAALGIVSQPTNNVANLYYLMAAVPPYQPTYTSPPSTFQLTIAGAPTIISASPPGAYVGYTIVISGNGFGAYQGSGSVVIGGVQASATDVIAWSDTQISVKVPSGAVTGSVVVYANGYASNSVSFTVTAYEVLELDYSLSLDSGPPSVGVSITASAGSHFGASAGSVLLNNESVNIISWTDSLIVVQIPSDAQSGAILVNIGPLFTPNPVNFTVTSPVGCPI